MRDFEEPCRNCGRLIDIRNNGFCDLICKSERQEKIMNDSDKWLDEDVLPTWDDVKRGIRSNAPVGNEANWFRNENNRITEAKKRAWEEQRLAERQSQGSGSKRQRV